MSNRGWPTLDEEQALARQGYRWVAGLDEVGRGAWAGPVVAAAVTLPIDDPTTLKRLVGVRDSKLMTPQTREEALPLILETAVAVGIGIVDITDIDTLNIVGATKAAMLQAIAQLDPSPQALILDALTLPCPLPQRAFPRADQLCLSVAAASVVAKVTRDRLMVEYESQFPGYGFARHKGYGTADHSAALRDLGPCAIHRVSFAPVQAVQLRLEISD